MGIFQSNTKYSLLRILEKSLVVIFNDLSFSNLKAMRISKSLLNKYSIFRLILFLRRTFEYQIALFFPTIPGMMNYLNTWQNSPAIAYKNAERIFSRTMTE